MSLQPQLWFDLERYELCRVYLPRHVTYEQKPIWLSPQICVGNRSSTQVHSDPTPILGHVIIMIKCLKLENESLKINHYRFMHLNLVKMSVNVLKNLSNTLVNLHKKELREKKAIEQRLFVTERFRLSKENELSIYTKIERRVRQRCVFLPDLFTLSSKAILRELETVQRFSIGRYSPNKIRYSDDTF